MLCMAAVVLTKCVMENECDYVCVLVIPFSIISVVDEALQI